MKVVWLGVQGWRHEGLRTGKGRFQDMTLWVNNTLSVISRDMQMKNEMAFYSILVAGAGNGVHIGPHATPNFIQIVCQILMEKETKNQNSHSGLKDEDSETLRG